MTAAPLHESIGTPGGPRMPITQRRSRLAPEVALLAGALAGALAGCTATGPHTPETAAADVAQARKPAAVVAGDGAPPAPAPDGLTKDVLYRLLVGEIASQRDDLPLSLESYLAVARETGDAGVAARATKLAVFVRADEEALEAARLWSAADSSSVEARQVLASLLIRTGDIDGAAEHLETIVEMVSDPPGAGFHRAAELLFTEKDGESAIAVMKRLVRGHDADAEAQLALARLLARNEQLEEALQTVDRAFELSPDDAPTTVLRARLRHRANDVDGAFGVLTEFLERVPDSSVVRMAYARMLVDTKRYDQARAEFERLVADEPENDDARYALGLLLLQTERLDEATEQFERLAGRNARHDAAFYYLGRIAEAQQRLGDAIDAYRRVRRGEHRLNAQIRVAVLLAENDDLDAARRHLHGLHSENTRETVRIYRAEAGLLTRVERYEEAMAVFDASLQELPDNSDLLYSRGMLAERMDRLDIVERDMRAIIAREPDHADALNALGYTLADRTDRYAEAYALIQRAIELKPDESYIVDSLGWVLYRMGRHREALEHLRRAMSLEPDPEIAAHLGEVLWVLGNKAEAREVWSTALEAAPDDERLLDVIERFEP